MIKNDIIIKKEESSKMDDLMSKRKALENLVLICENNSLIRNEELYQRFLSDYQQTVKKIDELWCYLFDTYNIEEDESTQIFINYDTCTIYFKEIQ